ncbi:MAG: arginine--tRNA ligase [Bacteroidota bacterium]
MSLLHDEIKQELAGLLQQGLAQMGVEESLEDLYNKLGQVPKNAVGHVSFPLFPYAKLLRNAPPKLAAELAEKLGESTLVAEVKPVGPYLNFVLQRTEVGRIVGDSILSGAYFTKALTEDTPKTMVEYSQPNTHKEMHVGHMRNLALGDALIRLHRYVGYDILSATFPGDVGTHVAKCLWYLKYHNEEPIPETGKGVWLGKMYVYGNGLLREIEGTQAEVEAKAQMTEILKQLEAQAGEFYDLWRETREWSIDLMEGVYNWADVQFDVWYWESDVDADSVAYVKEQYEKGVFVESEGAIGMDLSEDGLGFALLLKRDGTGLYATKDVELARRKFQDYGIEKSVYIVDTRQAYHFKQVFKVLEKMGFDQARNCFHLQYNYVEGKEGMFSSRLGNAVPIMALITNLEEAIRKNYLLPQVEKGEMDPDEVDPIARIVAKGAIKYGMIRIDPAKKIVFDMREWIKIDGDSGPYQQYTFARINRLLRKQGFDPEAAIDWNLLDDPREMELLVMASRFNQAAVTAAEGYKPNFLTAYLYELARLYNNINNSIMIRDITDPVRKNSRMALHAVTAKIIEKGMAIMGISVPEKM